MTFRWPWYPWTLCSGPNINYPGEKKEEFVFLVLSYHDIASIFDMYINIKERIDVNQDGPSLVIEAAPPPPPEAPK